MNDEGKNNGSKPGKEFSDKADEFFDKGKDFADKAEDFFTEQVKKFKDSNAFGKISDALGKVEEIMENKSREFNSGEMGAKFDTFREKTEEQASELLKRAKEAGRKIGDQVDDTLDALKGKKDRTNNQDGGGI
ncbi:MAG: hypothetical protein NTY07_17295 [Bacteroidia bacterium]|nr:hypothetical protein [Bacteroidia bacterium]